MLEDRGTLEYTLIESQPIIGFNIWGERRIFLPQLLKFVLPDFDINVIEKAVSNLQINIFQCNVEQMNLLHFNDVVPKKVVRCGLIRKSDAERLCKYLLQPNRNCDKITDYSKFINHKSIEVIHTCFGEQRGTLYPGLYTSFDAKCIKCSTCDNFFKTFDFVGHTHKLDEVSNTFHWGFDSNNWRLLLLIGETDNMNMNNLNEAKSILDRVKTLFYEEELKKINKFYMSIVWRPSRKLKLPNPPKPPFLSLKPPHLNDEPVGFYQRNINRGLNNLRNDDFNKSDYAPNVYLNPKDNGIVIDSNIDDDDVEEYEDVTEKSLKCSDDVAMNVALQIKREVMPKDTITLGTISTFLNKKDINMNIAVEINNEKSLKSNYSPVVVAQSNASIPPQFLMLEALWSQLFRDIIQLTHLVQFNTNDERNRLVGQLIRCQDLFRSQWTNLAEENQGLKENLVNEQKRRQDMETIRDQMAISLKDLTVEKENLSEIVKQLQSKCEQLQSGIDLKAEKYQMSSSSDEECNYDNGLTKYHTNRDEYRMKGSRPTLKRQWEYTNEDHDTTDTDDGINAKNIKQMRQESIKDAKDGLTSSSDDEGSP